MIKIQFYVWKSVYLKFYRPKNSFWRQFLGQKHLKIVIFLSRRPVSVIFGIKTYLFQQNNIRIVIFSQFYVQKHIYSNLNVLKNDFERPKKLSKIAYYSRFLVWSIIFYHFWSKNWFFFASKRQNRNLDSIRR